jgi:hypothetical protein
MYLDLWYKYKNRSLQEALSTMPAYDAKAPYFLPDNHALLPSRQTIKVANIVVTLGT